MHCGDIKINGIRRCAMVQMLPSSVESTLKFSFCSTYLLSLIYRLLSLEKLEASAAELSKSTGRTCLAAQADVRQPQQLQEAVKKTIDAFGRIDYVVYGWASSFISLFPAFGLVLSLFVLKELQASF